MHCQIEKNDHKPALSHLIMVDRKLKIFRNEIISYKNDLKLVDFSFDFPTSMEAAESFFFHI